MKNALKIVFVGKTLKLDVKIKESDRAHSTKRKYAILYFFEGAPISLIDTFDKKNIVNCVSRINTNIGVKIKKSDRAHCKK